MTFAHDIPGYAQGFRFKNDPAFYDSDNTRFRDLAGYGDANALDITTGTPVFATPSGSNGQEGLTLDNTEQGGFLPAIPWEGSMIAVVKPSFTANAIIYPCLFGSASGVTSNGSFRIRRATAADFRYEFFTAGAVQVGRITKSDESLAIVAFESNQEDRQIHYSEDAVTVSSTTASTDDNQGNDEAIGYYNGSSFDGHKVRFGNLSGTAGDTAVSSHTCTMFELHCFQSRILTDHATETAAFIDTLQARYGVS